MLMYPILLKIKNKNTEHISNVVQNYCTTNIYISLLVDIVCVGIIFHYFAGK
jgi:hypothetical protein